MTCCGAVEERLDRVDQVLLGVEQVVAKVEVGQVPVVGLADDLVEQLDRGGELAHERVLGASDGGLELVALALELVRAVPGELQRVLGVLPSSKKSVQNLRKRGDLALVEGLLRSDHGVRVLLRVAQRGGDLGALEDVAVDRERDLGGADQEARSGPRSRRGPSRRAWSGKLSTMVLTVTCSPSVSLRMTKDSTSSAGAESLLAVSASNRPLSGFAAEATCCSL